jgi:hypothetical protein
LSTLAVHDLAGKGVVVSNTESGVTQSTVTNHDRFMPTPELSFRDGVREIPALRVYRRPEQSYVYRH